MSWALLQISSTAAQGWDRVGLVGMLITGITLIGTAFLFEWVVPGRRLKEKTDECEELAAENKKLWNEKVEDAKEQAALAQAYLKLREQDK